MSEKMEIATQEMKYITSDKQEVTLSFDIIKNLLVSGKPNMVTLEEALFFMNMCKAKGLNPFKKDCYLVKYDEAPAAIIVSIDYYRARAYSQPNCAGWEVGVIVRDEKGEIKRTNGLVLDNEKLLGAWFKAKPKGWDVARTHEVNLNGYLQYAKGGVLTRFWKKEKQPTQIMKVVEAQGLRAVWPSEFEKLYIREEIYEDSNDNKKYPNTNNGIVSMGDFKEKEDQVIDANIKPYELNELREKIHKVCMYLGMGDEKAAQIQYHQFADEVKETGEPGNIVKFTAPKLRDIDYITAQRAWKEIKEYFSKRDIDVKTEIGIEL